MKRVLLTALLFPLAALIGASCAIDDAPPPPASGGSAGAGTGGSAGSTTGGSAGTTTGGSGGDTTSTGGASGDTGGTAGSGTGGESTGGGAGATGGAGGATGGSAGTGGAGGTARDGGAGSTGMPEAAPPAETGSGGTVTPDTFAGIANPVGDKFVDSFYVTPCIGTPGTQDCVTFAGTCPPRVAGQTMEQQGVTSSEDFKVGGVAGTNYRVTISVNGIVEGKYYMGGMRAAGDAAPVDPDNTAQNTFYTGGAPVDFENYNIYKLMVLQPNGTTEVQHYYLNSFPTGTNFNAENHNSFAISYTAMITVPGQGVVRFYTADRNCRAIDNCGPGAGRTTACQTAQGRMVPNEPNLVFPATNNGKPFASLNSRNGAMQPFHAQLIHVRVTAVTAM